MKKVFGAWMELRGLNKVFPTAFLLLTVATAFFLAGCVFPDDGGLPPNGGLPPGGERQWSLQGNQSMNNNSRFTPEQRQQYNRSMNLTPEER